MKAEGIQRTMAKLLTKPVLSEAEWARFMKEICRVRKAEQKQCNP